MACFRLNILVVWAAACLTLITAFDINSKSNVVVYYGQGNNQKRLSTYCTDPSIDILILSFVHLFPQQANGFPGINFGNQCSSDRYRGPGASSNNDASKDNLLKCPELATDLLTCRAANKKILLSLGGATPEYQLNGQLDGSNFATQLWGMFGPRQPSWVSQGLPRPFDSGDVEFAVDGFDLDIEHASTDNNAGYRALVTRLRTLYATESRPYYLTASPQCVVPDANMGEILRSGVFDMVFVQFYNTPECSARRWVEANRNYAPGAGAVVDNAGLTFDAWVSFLAGTPSSTGARVYISLPGAPEAANPGFHISSAQARMLAAAYYCRPNFGGIAIWEATFAAGNVEDGRNYFQNAKESLRALAGDWRMSCGAWFSPPDESSRPPEGSSPSPQGAPSPPEGSSSSPNQSTDGRCGDGFGTACGSTLCCSQWSWCGASSEHCGAGCQMGFGSCTEG